MPTSEAILIVPAGASITFTPDDPTKPAYTFECDDYGKVKPLTNPDDEAHYAEVMGSAETYTAAPVNYRTAEWKLEVDDSAQTIFIPPSTAREHGFGAIEMTLDPELTAMRKERVFVGPKRPPRNRGGV